MRKATAFRGGANKTAPPCETLAIICYLATVPGEQLQRKYLTENPALGENWSSASGKRGFHPCFCLPACCNCPVALSEFTSLILMIQSCLNGTVSKNAIAAGKTSCKIQFASQMWATRPHLGSIFEKLLHRKTFQLPAARILQPLFFHNKKAPFYKDAFR